MDTLATPTTSATATPAVVAGYDARGDTASSVVEAEMTVERGSASIPQSWQTGRFLLRPPRRFRQRPRGRISFPTSCFQTFMRVAAILTLSAACASAAFIPFENCLDRNVRDTNPRQLQFVPLNVSAVFNTTDESHGLNVTVYGTVAGSTSTTLPPPPGDPHWSNPNETLGKIVDVSDFVTTFFAKFDLLSYTPYKADPSPFCKKLVHGECPLGPAFGVNSSDLARLPAISVSHQLYAKYAFTTIAATLRVTSGDKSAATLACVSANITPDLGRNIDRLLAYIPLAILALVGFATVFAAVFSPWGSADVFCWTSNYGRDADLLRLVTPGFGDCLQYIQFVVLTGALSLSYPGYYQPVVSQAGWSTLMFNTSFVSRGEGINSLVDGIYVTNGTFGLERMSELVGMTTVKDIWAGMMIWLLVIIGAVIALIQAGFIFRWGYHHLSHVQEEDLRAKNLPFSMGNVIRIVFNYFLLPLVALTFFELAVTTRRPTAPVATAFAVTLLLLLLGFAIWVLRVIAKVRPRSYLFDDLPTVLLYGPLYNTYSDNAAPFALVPIFLQFLRGVAIGAVQQSGIAQLILLAICEVIYILTIHAFRPYFPPTSMNAYQTFFAVARLLTTLLSVTFVPSLGVTEGSKGWIGYVILVVHATILIFGFVLNAIQTIVEVVARLSGGGGEEGVGGGVARGGLTKVFGSRQLSRRTPRRQGVSRQSMASEGTLIGGDRRLHGDGRPRSTSGSSAALLNRHGASDGRGSVGLDSLSGVGGAAHSRSVSGSAHTPTTPGAASPFSYIPGDMQDTSPADPYYRPPRPRRPTMEGQLSNGPSGSWGSGDWSKKRGSMLSRSATDAADPMEGPSTLDRDTPMPAHMASRELSDLNVNESRRPKTDYAVREVDFYYGVRGPALSTLPTRRLGTGPADPTGPIASAAGWLKGLFGGKTKEKGKGFEVVRSSRAPPAMGLRGVPEAGPTAAYRDDVGPSNGDDSEAGVEAVALVDVEQNTGPQITPTSASPDDEVSSVSSESGLEDSEGEEQRRSQISPVAPSLPRLETGDGIELPSRFGSRASSPPSKHSSRLFTPKVPRKSSKRKKPSPLVDVATPRASGGGVPAIWTSSPTSPHETRAEPFQPPPPPASEHTLRTSRAPSPRLPFESEHSSVGGSQVSTDSSVLPPLHGDDTIVAPRPTRDPATLSGGAIGRPTSMGFVHHHRASESIHTATHSEGPDGVDIRGSAAEIVDDPATRNTSLVSGTSAPL